MNVEKNKNTLPQDSANYHDAEAEFHVALGWLTALSVMIATAAVGTVS